MAATSTMSCFLSSQDLLLTRVVLRLHGNLPTVRLRRGRSTTGHFRRVSWCGGLQREGYNFA